MPSNVLSYLVSPFLLQGALLTLQLSVVAMGFGLLLGLGLALLRLSRHAPLRGAAWFYIWFVRGTPLLLQLVFIYDVLPAVGIRLDTFTTAVLGFALNEAAFSAEIIRGGVASVNRNQAIAAAALGMPGALTFRRIVLPQAMRAILPGIANQAISMIKGTSIASIIFVNELTFRAEQIVGQNFRFFQVFAAAGTIYLAMTSAVAVAQLLAERHFNYLREPQPSRQSRWKLWHSFGLATASSPAPKRPEPEHSSPPQRPVGDRREAFATLVADVCHDDAVTPGEPFVVCRNVQKSYGSRTILQSIDLTVNRGEVVVLMGPSGSGKSTLLRLINHLEAVDWGEITIDGKLVGYERLPGGRLRAASNLAHARAEARIGMVFQHFNLFEHLTALENIAEAPVRVYGQDPERARALALRLLAAVGLAEHAAHLPHRLSGGQQQRVAIARALAVSPRLMLFDEPTSALDPELVGEVLTVLRGLAQAGMTMIVVTHEVRFAREVADRVVFMDEGLVVEQGPPEQLLDHPEQERTQRFLRMVAQTDASAVAESSAAADLSRTILQTGVEPCRS
jgi:polar amino acid transport system permease protein